MSVRVYVRTDVLRTYVRPSIRPQQISLISITFGM